MLGDLCRSDWLELLHLTTAQVPQVLIMRGTRNLNYHYTQYKRWFEDVIEIGSPNAVFEDLLIGQRDGHTMAYASVYGAAMASEIVHLCGILGTRAVILTGCCGGLDERLEAGDLVCATSAYRGEGASQYYLRDLEPTARGPWASASAALVKALGEGKRSVEIGLLAGPLYTTSALFAERAVDMDRWHDIGCLAADMETASVLTVAETFGMARASLLFVFDSPRQGSHVLLEEQDKGARRALGEQEMIRLTLGLADQIAAGTMRLP